MWFYVFSLSDPYADNSLVVSDYFLELVFINLLNYRYSLVDVI